MTSNYDEQWIWWQNALAGKVAPIDAERTTDRLLPRSPQGQDGFSPVAYWLDSKTDKQRCHVNGKDFDEQRALELWPYASKRPVRPDAYQERLRQRQVAGRACRCRGPQQSARWPTIAALEDRIEDLAREAGKLIAAGPAQSDEEANQATDLAQTFGELEGKISRLHKDEKEPYLEAGRTVDRKWFGLRDRAAELKRRLKAAVVTPFLTRKRQETENAEAMAVLSGADPATLPQTRADGGHVQAVDGVTNVLPRRNRRQSQAHRRAQRSSRTRRLHPSHR